MPYDKTVEIQNAITQEIKALQEKCVDACNIIENAGREIPPQSFDEVDAKKVQYVEGLRQNIQNSNTPIITDNNFLTCQFLSEIKDKCQQIEELTAFTKGNLHDLDTEINILRSQIKIAEEAKLMPKTKKSEVTTDQLQKAKERFQLMKSELHGLINSLFPNEADAMIGVLGQLMQERLNEESSGYIAVTTENFTLIELLKDISIVTVNPYNDKEVKLA